ELGYVQRVDINNERDIESNIKAHLERLEWLKSNKLNNGKLTDFEFQTYILNVIKNMDVYSASKKLRDIFIVKRPNRENIRLKCLDLENYENNVFEFSSQVKHIGKYTNISDLSIFINGFPICNIELKRSNVEINEAFNQIARYKVEAFDKNINKFIQIFVISNKEITRYFSNSKKIKKEFIFPWSDEENNHKNNLFEFSNSFFEKQVLFKLITKYIVIEESGLIKILRSYQYHAVEKILDHIERTNELNNKLIDLDERSKKLNAYVFHATGSGKTLTSFKLSELLMKDSTIHKVIFLVYRLDLNTQTINEFNKFGDGDLDPTENTKKLSLQLKDSNSKLIVTTIHKLNKLI
ncbi:MAG: type I restriction endonuclease, partial [Metamycoplasmataceae bacterium]